MKLEIKVGSVSWIKLEPNPVTIALEGKAIRPNWVPKTYIGLAATANEDPPTNIADFGTFRRGKDFRAMTYAHLGVEIDDSTKAITRIMPLESFTDPGYTPPFNLLRPISAAAWFPSLTVGSAFDGWQAFKSAWNFSYHEGEQSPISSVVVGARHENSSIGGVPANETVVVNQLIKFRAGEVTDNVGVTVVEAPYHVPWVWCETLVTYVLGKFKLYGRGSVFPNHAWYSGSLQMITQARIGDRTFPKKPLRGVGAFGLAGTNAVDFFEINVPALALYPVLSKGAVASGPQTPLSAENGLKGSVEKHPFTVDGGSLNLS